MVLHGIQCDKCDNFPSSFPAREPPSLPRGEAKLARTCIRSLAANHPDAAAVLDISSGDIPGALTGLLVEAVVDCGLDLALHEMDKALDPGLTKYQKKKLERRPANDDP